MKKGRKRVDLSVFTEEQILEIIRFYGIETSNSFPDAMLPKFSNIRKRN